MTGVRPLTCDAFPGGRADPYSPLPPDGPKPRAGTPFPIQNLEPSLLLPVFLINRVFSQHWCLVIFGKDTEGELVLSFFSRPLRLQAKISPIFFSI